MKNISSVLKLIKKKSQEFPLPWVTELAKRSKNPYLVLVAALISVRTQDKTTKNSCLRLFAQASTPAEMLRLGPEKIKRLIYPCGFYRRKGKQLVELAKILQEKYKGKVPADQNLLMELPGVGRKVANLVLGLAFGFPAICVDTHVHRISNRLGWVRTKDVLSTERELMKFLPQKYWVEINTWLVAWGQNICMPHKPKCFLCPLTHYCRYYA